MAGEDDEAATKSDYRDVQVAFRVGGVEEVKSLGASPESIRRAARKLKTEGIDVQALEDLLGHKVRGRRVVNGALQVTRKVQQHKQGRPFLVIGAAEAGYVKGEESRVLYEEGTRRIIIEPLETEES